ncbi:Clavaminate synthase-like protein [Mycena vulgaris]|nr:Clavaminate synthase-like protein [Mycena vulgaris]
MAIDLSPLPLPETADASRFADFGREVKGINPGALSTQELEQLKEALYKHDVLLFRNVLLTPEQQYALTKAFDPDSESYGHGNNKTGGNVKSILHPDLKTIPRVPQVQLIGNGNVYEHEGLSEARLKHPSHTTFHKTRPPRVTTLYGITVPSGNRQTCRYDDGTGDELPVPLGTTAFVSGRTIVLQVRSRVKYAPHPYVWMAPAHAALNWPGTGIGSLELPLSDLPPWEEAKIKILPVVSTAQNLTDMHPCGAAELLVDPLPAGAKREGALYPDGGHIKDIKDVRAMLYKMQRPAIAPKLVYPHDWSEKDLVLFHNRGVLHTVVGAFADDQVRAFHQCNLAASEDPVGPNAEDVEKWC